MLVLQKVDKGGNFERRTHVGEAGVRSSLS